MRRSVFPGFAYLAVSALTVVVGISLLFPSEIFAQSAPSQAQPAVPAARLQIIRNISPASPLPAGVMVTTDGGLVVAQDGSVAPAAGPDAQANAAADQAVEQQKQQILQALFFDRRPSTILKAWALTSEEFEAELNAELNSVAAGEEVSAPADAAAPAADAAVNAAPANVADDAAAVDATAAPAAESAGMTDEQKAAQKAAEETARKAAEEQAKQAKERQQKLVEFQKQIRRLQRSVTLGNWTDAKTMLMAFVESDRGVIYEKLISSLVQGPPDSPRDRSGEIIGEKNVIRAVDVIALGEMCPEAKLNDSQVLMLGQLTTECQSEGETPSAIVESLRAHLAVEMADRRINQRISARILFAAGRAADAQEFLPSYPEVIAGADSEAMELYANTCMARLGGSEQSRAELLEQAWGASQAILSLAVPAETPEMTAEQKAGRQTLKTRQLTALQLAVSLVPMIREDLGESWLVDSFTKETERGKRLLNGIGSTSAQSMAMHAGNPDERLKLLKLQQTALKSLFSKAPERAAEWKDALHLMAVNWLREASYSAQYDQSSQRGPIMQRDEFGNLFWTNEPEMPMRQFNNRSGSVSAISSGEVLDAKPSDEWLKYMDENYRPSLAIATARLHLRVKEEAQAFPQIELLAATHKDIARELVEEFLNVWAENHDPNSQSRRTNIYMFSFGYSQRLSGIPLTRSRQQRNVKELADWVARIRKLPIDSIDETWIASAFAKVYSTAEVYQLADLEAVFGSVDTLEPRTLASLLETMRGNLNSVWRAPQIQQDAKTNRKKNDIEREVLNGYATALQMVEKGLTDHPKDWGLTGVKFALLHDLNNYQSEMTDSSEFTQKRRDALAGLKSACELYAAESGNLKDNEQTVSPFNTWFCASLGACDVNQITQERIPILDQMPLIRQVLDTLPAAVREKHLNMFANDLFTRMSSVNPAVKFRYVREGLNIVGDRPQAIESKKLLDYYSDLVTEIQLDTVVDGTPRVGHGQPFGVLVSIRHTQAIERESGGFGRYLQNQNSGGGYYYNNGRPNENYRDRFEKSAREALNEHFEVLSVTFEPESIKSLPLEETGWRRTPYAYVLLKPRGPEIDRVPPLRLDLDFLDTSGYVVLPVESQAVSIDCTPAEGDTRPLKELTVTQTLDERQSRDGKLILEVKAVAKGLVPDLSNVVDVSLPDFEIESTEDNGLLISRFDPDSEEPIIVSERLWTLTLRDKQDTAASAEKKFTFPASVGEPKEVVYQVYDDADLKAVEQTIALQAQYEPPASKAWMVLLIVPVVAGLGLVGWLVTRRPSGAERAVVTAFRVPEEVTPFTVLRLLKDIEQAGGIQANRKSDLSASINRIERYYFADERNGTEPDLKQEAKTWVSQVTVSQTTVS